MSVHPTVFRVRKLQSRPSSSSASSTFHFGFVETSLTCVSTQSRAKGKRSPDPEFVWLQKYHQLFLTQHLISRAIIVEALRSQFLFRGSMACLGHGCTPCVDFPCRGQTSRAIFVIGVAAKVMSVFCLKFAQLEHRDTLMCPSSSFCALSAQGWN
jgi:hypothetical protein